MNISMLNIPYASTISIESFNIFTILGLVPKYKRIVKSVDCPKYDNSSGGSSVSQKLAKKTV